MFLTIVTLGFISLLSNVAFCDAKRKLATSGVDVTGANEEVSPGKVSPHFFTVPISLCTVRYLCPRKFVESLFLF